MDHVLARVKGLRKQPFFKLLSDHTLFEVAPIDVTACVLYNPDHNLDEEAWFKIEEFSKKPYCIDILKANFDSKIYADLKKEQFSKIAYLIAIQGKDFYFQKVMPSLFIRRKIVIFGEVAEVENGVNRLVINQNPDAIYVKDSDTLIFRNLATITSIFDGIDQLYREATQQETEKFLKEPFITLKNNFDVDKVSKPNRKRIALAMETLAKLPRKDQIDMCAYIQGYCNEKLKYDKKINKFELSSDNELKLLLYGIEQRFYTTQFGQEKRLANSVQAIN